MKGNNLYKILEINLGNLVLSTHDWMGDVSVGSGQHLKVLDKDGIIWWRVKVEDTGEMGYVLSDITKYCPQHTKHCRIARENYNHNFYLRFKQGDKIAILQGVHSTETWSYGKHLETHEKGYLHNNWICSKSQYVKLVLLTILGSALHGTDIVTDMLNGLNYMNGTTMPSNVSNRNCDDLGSYSHIAWGSFTVALTWLPAIPTLVVTVINIFESFCTGVSVDMRKMYLLRLFVCLIWPISSIVM